MAKSSIRARLVGFALLISLGVGGLIAAYSLYAQRQSTLSESESQGNALAALLAETLADPIYQLRIDEAARLLAAAQRDQDVAEAYALDRNGYIVSDGSPDSLQIDRQLPGMAPVLEQVRHSGSSVQRRENGRFLDVTTAVHTPDGETIGFVHLKISLDRATGELMHATAVLLAITAAALILGSALALWLARGLVRPLRRMAEATRAISHGNLDIHVPVERQDELGELAHSINAMSRDLQNKTVSKTFLDNIVQSMGDTLIVTDAHGIIRLANRAVLELLGYREEELIGLPASKVAGLEPGGYTGMLRNREVRYRTAGGSDIPVSLSLSMLSGVDGKLQGWVLVAQDITERKQSEAALKKLNENLENRVAESVAELREKDHLLIQQSRLAAMGEMIGNIAHQWRQPLNTLGLIIQNLRYDFKDGLVTHEHMDKASMQAMQMIQSMSRTIDDFRNFFKPNRDKIRFNLCQAIDDALAIIGNGLRNHGIEVRFDRRTDFAVLGYPNEFAQVILNLAGNAKDALVERQIKDGWIAIRLTGEDGMATVSVSDNAGGVPEDIRERIFDPYFTTREKGTGIGLYMSKMIVEYMGGTISVSNGGEGAEFSASLPCVRE